MGRTQLEVGIPPPPPPFFHDHAPQRKLNFFGSAVQDTEKAVKAAVAEKETGLAAVARILIELVGFLFWGVILEM